jgi:hypothetical protein
MASPWNFPAPPGRGFPTLTPRRKVFKTQRVVFNFAGCKAHEFFAPWRLGFFALKLRRA